jgi:hypothetical protein
MRPAAYVFPGNQRSEEVRPGLACRLRPRWPAPRCRPCPPAQRRWLDGDFAGFIVTVCWPHWKDL